MVAQVHEVLTVLVLTCTTIGEIEHFLWLLSEHLLKEQKMLLKQMDCNDVMRQAQTATHDTCFDTPFSNQKLTNGPMVA